jgi:cysteine desulfurase
MDPRVFEAMRPYFLEEFGNAGSRTHLYGQRAKAAVDRARKQVADLLGVGSDEIHFTSGATESNNLVILGLRQHAEATGRRHVLTTAIEHKAVLEPMGRLREAGLEVELLPVTAGGYVEPDEVRRRLRPDTLLVSVMHANNVTGVLQPVREVAGLLDGTRALFHTDAAQTFGKEVEALRGLRGLRCHFLSVSARCWWAAGRRWATGPAPSPCPWWSAWARRPSWRAASTRSDAGPPPALRRASSGPWPGSSTE